MKHVYFALFIILITCSAIQAQEKKADFPLKGLLIGTNFVSLMEPDAGPSLSLEYRFNRTVSIVLEGTWIMFDQRKHFNMRGEHTPMAEGLRLRPEARFYLPRGSVKSSKAFFGCEFLYKRVTNLEERIEQKGTAPNGEFAYEEIKAYEKTKEMFGMAGKFGFQTFFDPAHKVFFELHIGLGLKYRNSFYKTDPPENSYLEDNKEYSSLEFPDNGWHINVPLGLKVGYRF